MKKLQTFILFLGLARCSSLGLQGKEEKGESSLPINHKETVAYKQAIIRCHKTGGTRIIKVNNVLRCF